MVADALSRNQINVSTEESAISSVDSSPVEKKIKRVSFPLNRYKNQFEISVSDHNSLVTKMTFANYKNHKVQFRNEGELIANLRLTVSDKHLNAIYSTVEIFYSIKENISNAFPNANFVFTMIKVANITDLQLQLNIVSEIHERAHRNAINNYTEAQKDNFWPNMKSDFLKWVNECEICKTQKYERIPVKQPIGTTSIPVNVGESISMDLFYIDKKLYVTSVDRYSKNLMVHRIENKLNFHEKLEEIITQNYPNCKTIITDNEAIFISNATKIIYQKYKITHVTTPVQHSTSNGQVERTHSTLIELIRCLKTQNSSSATEQIYNATKAYNETIHSVTRKRPIDIKQNPTSYANISKKILEN